jgi:electron transfer flavoprotein beta subunit
MDIWVLMKQVPDTETQIRVAKDSMGIVEDDIKWVINPYCEFAIEEALRTRERFGGTVTVVSIGPQRVVEALRTALAMGADRAIQVCDEALWGIWDSYSRARVLARVLSSEKVDIIFTGKQAIDDDMAQVSSAVAELLGIPQVNVVNKLEFLEDGRKVRAHRQIEGGIEVVECSLPVLVSCQKGLNEPRYASLPGIMKAKKKPLDVRDLASLGLDASEVGVVASRVELRRVELPPVRKAGRIIDGETPEEKAVKLARALREEAKVI